MAASVVYVGMDAHKGSSRQSPILRPGREPLLGLCKVSAKISWRNMHFERLLESTQEGNCLSASGKRRLNPCPGIEPDLDFKVFA